MKTPNIRGMAIALAVVASSLSGASAAEPDVGRTEVPVAGWRAVLRAGDMQRYSPPVFPVQQVYGQRCVTPVGWCPIDPQPVGSPCLCGNVEGTTLQ